MGRFGEAARALAAEGVKTRAVGALLNDSTAGKILWDDPAGSWSIKDVLGHVDASHKGLLLAAQGRANPAAPGHGLVNINEERRRERREWPLARVLSEIERGRAEALTVLEALPDSAWQSIVRTSSGREMPVGRLAWILSSHERDHREQIEAALGRAVPGGRVAWLNASNGGVPKLPMYSARLHALGLEGDAHRHPMHGGPTAALCLFSLEVIQALQSEGHPISPGAIGENVTVSGLDWAQVKPGDRLRIGPALVEITRYTTPCTKIAGAFTDGQFERVLHTIHPGQARVYASIVEEGEIAVGDAVEHLPLG